MRERRRRHEDLDRGRHERAERTNGIASTSSEPKTIRKFCSHATRSGRRRERRPRSPPDRRSRSAPSGARRSAPAVARSRGRATSTAISSTSRTRSRTRDTRLRTSGLPFGACIVSIGAHDVVGRHAVRGHDRLDRGTARRARRRDDRRCRPRRSTLAATSGPGDIAVGVSRWRRATNVVAGTRRDHRLDRSPGVRAIRSRVPPSTTPRMSGSSSAPNPASRRASRPHARDRVGSDLDVVAVVRRCTRSRRSDPVDERAPRPVRSGRARRGGVVLVASVATTGMSVRRRSTGHGRPCPRGSTDPVMPCCDGGRPVPIVVRIAAGSSGSEPVVPGERAGTGRQRPSHARPGGALERRTPPCRRPSRRSSTTSGPRASPMPRPSARRPLRISG